MPYNQKHTPYYKQKRLTIRMLSVPDYYRNVVMVRMYVVVLWLYSTWRTYNDTALLSIHGSLQFYAIFNLSHIFPHCFSSYKLVEGVLRSEWEAHRTPLPLHIYNQKWILRVSNTNEAASACVQSKVCLCIALETNLCTIRGKKNKINFFGFRLSNWDKSFLCCFCVQSIFLAIV